VKDTCSPLQCDCTFCRDAAEHALAAADKKLTQLEVAAPKAAQVAKAKLQEAEDLQSRLEEAQAATKVSADDAARTAELGRAISDDVAALAKLRAGCAGLQKQVAALQVKVDQKHLETVPHLASCALVAAAMAA
jgi:hypothetical protein